MSDPFGGTGAGAPSTSRGVPGASDRLVVRVIGVAALLAAVVSVAVLAWGGGMAGVVSWFSFWVLAPMILCGAIALFMPETLASWPRMVFAVLALALGPSAYVSLWLGPPDANDALIFVFMPLWQLVALAGVILWGVVVEAWRATRRPKGA